MADGTESDPTITVLHVDFDAEAWDGLASFVEDIEDVAVERVTDPELARESVRRGGIDVVVTSDSVPAGADDPLLETAKRRSGYRGLNPRWRSYLCGP